MIETRPVYEQLLDDCQQRLAAGEWTVGERFPSERDLALRHGISRVTANKVLAKLASEGWLEHRRGVGMYVAERPTLFASLQRMESFTEFAASQGFTPHTEVLAFERDAKTPSWVSTIVEPGTTTWIYLERLRLANSQPVIFERRWLPATLYPRLTSEMVEGSFFDVCRRHYNLQAVREEAEIRAVHPVSHPRLCWELPALRLRGFAHDDHERLLWVQELLYRGDRFTLFNHVGVSTVPRLGLRMSCT